MKYIDEIGMVHNSKWFTSSNGLQYHQDNPIFKAGAEYIKTKYKEGIMHVCRTCQYILTDKEKDKMLDGKLSHCPSCNAEFGVKK